MSRVSAFELPPMLYGSYQAVIARDAYERKLIQEDSVGGARPPSTSDSTAPGRGGTASTDSTSRCLTSTWELVNDAARAISQLIVPDELARCGRGPKSSRLSLQRASRWPNT